MAKNSKIEWTDHTFNPWLGCTKISPACTHCYAEAWSKRSGLVVWGADAERRRTSESYWIQPFRWNEEAAASGIRRRVFCASLADVFEGRNDLNFYRLELFNLIRQTPNLDWLLLTKRPENILRAIIAAGRIPGGDVDCYDDTLIWLSNWLAKMPPKNVWVGTTVENQETADQRIPHLLKVPAVVRFLSCEPVFSYIDLKKYLFAESDCGHSFNAGIDWVIAGGESGQHARPSHPEWFSFLRNQCTAASVPFLFKQWGEWLPLTQLRTEQVTWNEDANHSEHHWSDNPDDFSIRVGKKVAGRVLDNCTWDEIPRLGGVKCSF